MKHEYDVIVAGGGLAGLTAAAYSARQGLRTLLCEQGEKTGGLVNTFWQAGFAFDAGIRAFENSGIIFPMLKSLGIELEVVKNEVSIGIGREWTRLDGQASLADYAAMLSRIFPDHKLEIEKIAGEIEKVMGYMDVLYGIDNPLFRDDFKDRQYLVKTLLPWLVKYRLNIGKASRLDEPVNDYLRRFTANQSLIDMITQHFFKNTPTFFALSYFSLYLDYSYPKGGTGRLAQKVTDYILANGGEVRTKTRIQAVDPQKREVRTSAGETMAYEKLVWAADQKTLYRSLSGEKTPQVQKQAGLALSHAGGDSILTLFIGVALDHDYFRSRCGAHAFYTPVTRGLSSLPDWETVAPQGDDALWQWVKDYLAHTTYEISCPALRDPTLAPAGQTGLIVSTLMDYRLVRKISKEGGYAAFKQLCLDEILSILEKSLFQDLRKHVVHSSCSTPLTIERETNNSEGAITGWAFTDSELPSESRFKRIAQAVKTPLPDVYQCGQWTFSPSGLPVSILTGKLAADEVAKSLKAKKS